MDGCVAMTNQMEFLIGCRGDFDDSSGGDFDDSNSENLDKSILGVKGGKHAGSGMGGTAR